MVDLAACGKFPAMSLNPVALKFFTFCKQYVGVLSHHFSDRELNTIDGFHSDVIRVQSQKSEVVRILIYTRLKNNRKEIFVQVSSPEACFISKIHHFELPSFQSA